MGKRVLHIAGATVNQIPMDWSNNVSNIRSAIASARSQQANILCFPELCLTGYGCEDQFLSDWLPESAWRHLQPILSDTEGITVCIGLPVRFNGITYNGVCVIENKRILGITLKQFMARDGVHYEPRWFDPWPPGIVKEVVIGNDLVKVGDLIYETKGIRFGFEICEDSWRKEKRPGFSLHERKVDLILNPSASHFAFGKSLLRQKEVVIDGSSRFECVYLFVNLLGNEAGRMIYDGDIILGQRGKIIKVNNRLSFLPFQVQVTKVDFDEPEMTLEVPITDSSEKVDEFARAGALALFDYLRKSQSKGYVLSLSGGADSSCCAVMVAEMVHRGSLELGWEKFCQLLKLPPISDSHDAVGHLLVTAYQGTVNSSKETYLAAEHLASSLGAHFYSWEIEEEVQSYEAKIEKVIGRKLTWEKDDIARQNIQARSRSPIIWMLANIRQSILLTTSNRSEGDVGYATMDGDTSGSLAPIAGVDKQFVIEWLRWAEINRGYSGLSAVNQLKPTAELRPVEKAQTDEKDLMPYPLLVAIELLAIRDRKPPIEVYRILQNKLLITPAELKVYIKKFFKLWSVNQWKRERFAPSFHYDDLNIDPRSWCRFPILSSGFKEELEELDSL